MGRPIQHYLLQFLQIIIVSIFAIVIPALTRLLFHTNSRYTCKLVLKLYTKLYLPTSMSSYRSSYLNGQYQNMKWNFASEMEGCWIANNNSYVPRFSEARLMTSILGRNFEVFDVSTFEGSPFWGRSSNFYVRDIHFSSPFGCFLRGFPLRYSPCNFPYAPVLPRQTLHPSIPLTSRSFISYDTSRHNLVERPKARHNCHNISN